MNKEIKIVPVREGLWTSGEKPLLIGSRCNQCREVYFPKRDAGRCPHCQSTDLSDLTLGTRGKVYSYTVVMQRPPIYYQAEVPYALGFVELPDGVRVETLFTDVDPEKLHIGMEVELVIGKLHGEEDGVEVHCYKFKPVGT